jgi:hypothetical protein
VRNGLSKNHSGTEVLVSSRYFATVSVAMVRSGCLRQRLLFDSRVAARRTPLLEKEDPHRCFVKGLSAHRGKT